MQKEDKTVNVVKSKRHSKPSSQRPQRQENQRCGNCGYVHPKGSCPAKGKTCHKCLKSDHFSSVCKSTKPDPKKRNRKGKVHTLDYDSSQEEYCGMLTEWPVNIIDDDWTVQSQINNKPIVMQIDTGAKCNVISKNVLNKTGIKTALSKPQAALTSYSGHKIRPLGAVQLDCTIKGQTFPIQFHVVDIKAPTVLGAKSCVKFGLIERVNGVQTQEPIETRYEDLFEGLGCLPYTYSNSVDPTVTPVVHPPRKVSFAMHDKVKTSLQKMENDGVIIRQNEATEWVNSMVTVIKSDGSVRICLDPRDLNKAILREHYPMKTIEEIVPKMQNAKVFSKLDAIKGFWQMKIDEKSQKLCTFNTPFGRYSFKRLPFGIKSAPEVYQRTISEMVENIDGCEAIVDDICIWGENLKQHDERLRKVLDKCREYDLRLNFDKCEFRKDSITYVGHQLTSEGVKPDPEKIRAVNQMKRPENVKELQSFMGFIQYLGKFIQNMSQISAPLRVLLEKATSWHWNSEQEFAFNELKRQVTNAPVLRYYDSKQPLTLSVDSSSKGMGAVLLQNNRPLAYASRALTNAQQNYAQIEKETLAITYGCMKFHQYVFAREVLVESDHKPLQSIFTKPLFKAPARLQRLLLDLQKYDLKVTYKPGKTMFLADALSRNFLQETTEDLKSSELTVNLLTYLPVTEERYVRIKQATSEDTELQRLTATVLNGWPEKKKDVQVELRPYWNFRDEISCLDGLLFKGHKLVIPKQLRKEYIDIIHQSHQGIVRCKSRARDTIFWLGMSSDIEQAISKCSTCAQNQRSNSKEPMMKMDLPDRPWSKVSSDVFTYKGTNYLLTVDSYSKWIEISKLDNMTSKNTIHYLKSQFSRYGIVDELYTDNGTNYASAEFREFVKSYGFKHVTHSPHHHSGNGLAERAVQTVKNLLKKSKDPYKAMLDYRNTIIDDIGLSPAQMFLGRRLKTNLPTTSPLLKPDNADVVKQKLQNRQNKQKEHHDKTTSKVPLKPFKVGDEAVMRHDNKEQWRHVTIKKQHETPRSYVVETPEGKVYRRNRKHLRHTASKPINRELYDFEIQPQNESPNVVSKTPPQQQTPATETMVKTRSGRIVKPPERYGHE